MEFHTLSLPESQAEGSCQPTIFIVIGLAACGFTRGLFNSTVLGVLLDLCLGVIGAVTAGSLCNYIVGVGTARLDIASMLVAIAGAAALLAAYHAILPGVVSWNDRSNRWPVARTRKLQPGHSRLGER